MDLSLSSKFCSKCQKQKNLDEFYKEKRSKSGYQVNCKECFKSYYIENKEKYKALKNGNKKYLKGMKSYFESNKDSINEYKRKRYSQELGKLKVKAVAHKRRALKITTCDGSINADSLRQLLLKQKYKCAISGKDLMQYDLDHIIPLSKGGKHVLSNVQFVIPSINRSKKNRIDYEYK